MAILNNLTYVNAEGEIQQSLQTDILTYDTHQTKTMNLTNSAEEQKGTVGIIQSGGSQNQLLVEGENGVKVQGATVTAGGSGPFANLTGGNNDGAGQGGSVTIAGGYGNGGAGTKGHITMSSHSLNSTQDGEITFQNPDFRMYTSAFNEEVTFESKPETVDDSHALILNSGSTSFATGSSGAVSLFSGAATGATSGDTGAVSVKSGDATSGTSGNMTLESGTGDTFSGSVSIKSGNAAQFSGSISLQTGIAGTTRGSVSVLAENLNMNNSKIISVTPGAASGEAVEYDQMVSAINATAEGLSAKKAARVGSVVATFSGLTQLTDDTTGMSGTDFAYQVSTKELLFGTAITAIDGVTLAAANNDELLTDRILVKDIDEASGGQAKHNGIYYRYGIDRWRRTADFDETAPINEIAGAYVPVQEGTENEAKYFVQSGTVTALDTDPINFVFFNSASNLVGGNGITISGNTVSFQTTPSGSGLATIASGAYILKRSSLDLDAGALTVSTSHLAEYPISGLFAVESTDTAHLLLKSLDTSLIPSAATNEYTAVKGKDISALNYEGVVLTAQSGDSGTAGQYVTNSKFAVDGVSNHSGVVGDYIRVISGTNATPGIYEILAVTATTIETTTAIYSADPLVDDLAYEVFSGDEFAGANMIGYQSAAGPRGTSTGGSAVNVHEVIQEIHAQIGGDDITSYNFSEDGNVLADDDAVYAALDKLNNKHGDYASDANAEGASLIAIETGGNFTATEVEGALNELHTLASAAAFESFVVATGGVEKGDLLRFSEDDKVLALDNSSGATGTQFGFALAEEDKAATLEVKAMHDGQSIAGILSGSPVTFTAGDKVYYDSSQTAADRYVTAGNSPTVTGSKVWQVGIAISADDLMIDINFVKKNS